MALFVLSFFLIAFLLMIIIYFGFYRKLFQSFTTTDLVTISLFICLLYAAILPFKLGLSKLPFIHSFAFSIPYTCILIIGIRLIPKTGTTTLLIFGNGLFAQIISTGINPLWWPYMLITGFILEIYFLISNNYAKSLFNALTAGALRGALAYLYFYYIAGPFIWHKFYAPWYIAIQLSQGIIGSLIGAGIGFKLARTIEKAYKFGSV